MGNLSESIKKILSNKNTVTVIGIVLIIIVLYFAYNYRVNQATHPISVPFASDSISPGTQITEDKIGVTEITKKMATNLNAITDYTQVINRYSNPNSVIPKGSLFYEISVVQKDMISTDPFEYPKGWVPYHLDNVSIDSTYGNAMYPGNYIDIYLKIVKKQSDKVKKQSDYIVFSKLFENIKILSVKDSSSHDVFADLDNVGVPSMLIFALPEEDYIILKKCQNLGALSAEIVPVPTDESLQEKPGDIEIADKKLVEYINDNTLVR